MTILNDGYIAIMQKTDLPEMRDNDTKTREVCVDQNKFSWERMEVKCPVVQVVGIV